MSEAGKSHDAASRTEKGREPFWGLGTALFHPLVEAEGVLLLMPPSRDKEEEDSAGNSLALC